MKVPNLLSNTTIIKASMHNNNNKKGEKTMKKIILFLIILMTISGCFFGDENSDKITKEKSQIIAEEYVKNTYEFAHYNGINLNLTQISVQKCPSCWTFIFEFDVNTKETTEIKGFKISVPVNQGIIKDAVVKTITIAEAEKPQDAILVFDLLKNPIYNEEIKIYGMVSNLDTSSDYCFDLTSGEEKIIVRYDSFSKTSPVNIKDINNDDWIVIT
ncbi:MAG: hypothetical protein KAQ92_06260, partial [Candidatus Aenigmarchaeota archaeon]|nr:hypothetical protein [Candidatus Aenigmarchaeota archaeon]